MTKLTFDKDNFLVRFQFTARFERNAIFNNERNALRKHQEPNYLIDQ